MTYQETAYQKTNIVDASGNVINSFGGGGSGGGGDASATNQTTQIQLETAIRDRLPSTLVGGRLPVDVQSLTVTVGNAQLEISNDVGNPIPISGTVSLSGTPTVTISNSSIEIANDVGNPVPISGTVSLSGTPTVTISNSSIEIANDVGNPVPISGTVALSNTSIEIANDIGNPVPISGTVAISGLMPTSGTTYTQILGTTSSGFLKASAGNLYTLNVINSGAVKKYLHLFDQATPPSNGAAPSRVYPVGAGDNSQDGFLLIGQSDIGGEGIIFTAGIAWGISTTATTFTAATASETILGFRYK